MKRFFSLFFFFFQLSIFSQMKVVCTLPWIGDLARTIGGDRVNVEVLFKPLEDPHYVEAKPSMIMKVNKADLLFQNGLDLEIGYLPKIIEASNNPKIGAGKERNIDLSQFVEPIEVPVSVDRSMGDVHPLGNPHYYYSKENIKKIAIAIESIFSKFDPKGENYFKENLKTFLDKLNSKVQEWQKLNLKNKKVVTYHKLLEYLSKEFEFEIVANIEQKPGISPSAKHLTNLVEKIKKEKVDYIIVTNVVGEKEGRFLAEKCGIRLIVIPQDVNGMEGVKDLISMIDYVLKKIGE